MKEHTTSLVTRSLISFVQWRPMVEVPVCQNGTPSSSGTDFAGHQGRRTTTVHQWRATASRLQSTSTKIMKESRALIFLDLSGLLSAHGKKNWKKSSNEPVSTQTGTGTTWSRSIIRYYRADELEDIFCCLQQVESFRRRPQEIIALQKRR